MGKYIQIYPEVVYAGNGFGAAAAPTAVRAAASGPRAATEVMARISVQAEGDPSTLSTGFVSVAATPETGPILVGADGRTVGRSHVDLDVGGQHIGMMLPARAQVRVVRWAA